LNIYGYDFLPGAMMAMEKDHIAAMERLKNEHENELMKLKQENYVLSAKV
jgi:hypothetical protein